jgi:DNA (cytosine-5)-methyltransferase 1
MGGFRLASEKVANKSNYEVESVLTSEIKPYAVKVLESNFEHKNLLGDVREIEADKIEDFDFLFAGFPCQTFSKAGNKDGFSDTRGTLFFEIERILKEKKPYGFILENVDYLTKHDDGKTFDIIIKSLKNIGYNVSYKVLNSKNFNLPQKRKRVYMVGTLEGKVSLENFNSRKKLLEDVLEEGLELETTESVEKILKHYKSEDLYGKNFIDKRGGKNSIHSWDIELKGKTSNAQKILLSEMLKQRRRKKVGKNKKY